VAEIAENRQGQERRYTKPDTLLKQRISIRTWADRTEDRPGFCEIDLVDHQKGDIEMMNIEKSVVINRPVEEVFAYVAKGDNWSEWATELVESRETSEGPVGVGTTYTHVAQMLGRRIENGYEVTEYEPNRKFSMKSTSGPVPADVSLTVDSADGGARLDLNVHAEVGGFFKLAEPVIARMMDRQQDANLANLKDLLEAQAEASA
jgi:uncharacterized protein YndB with AHSA1/START domain